MHNVLYYAPKIFTLINCEQVFKLFYFLTKPSLYSSFFLYILYILFIYYILLGEWKGLPAPIMVIDHSCFVLGNSPGVRWELCVMLHLKVGQPHAR